MFHLRIAHQKKMVLDFYPVRLVGSIVRQTVFVKSYHIDKIAFSLRTNFITIILGSIFNKLIYIEIANV